MRIVDHHQCAVAVGKRADLGERCDRAVHGEHAVGDDQAGARVLAVDERLLELRHVAVGVAQPARLRQTDAIDDRGVVQRVGDDRVLVVGQGLKQPAVGIETGRVEDRVLGAEKGRQPPLEFAVDAVRAADETDRGHAVAVRIERSMRRADQCRMAGEAEVIVGAQVQHRAAARHVDRRVLRPGQLPLALVEAGGMQGGGLFGQSVVKGTVHVSGNRPYRQIPAGPGRAAWPPARQTRR